MLAGCRHCTVKQRSARIGRNPRTHEMVQVDEKTVPHFKAGREMLRRLGGVTRRPRAGTRASPAEAARRRSIG